MTAASTTSQARIDANRRNATRSTGPRSPQGRRRVAQNALKHGLTAQTVVLPGEDPDALQARVDAWKRDLRPADDVQDYLVERAAHVSWQLDRADRLVAARLTAQILAAPAERAAREAEEVADLTRQLFWDPAGHLALYPHVGVSDDPLQISWSGDLDDPLEPARIVRQLEATSAGCRWLLERWTDLSSLLESGRCWQAPDRFKATRLLGRQPMDAVDDERVMMIHLACQAMEPEGPPAFTDLRPEFNWYRAKQYAARAEGRGAAERMPADPAAGRAALLAIVGVATSRLEALLAYHEAAAAPTAGAAAAVGLDAEAFEDGPEGERVRRYHLGKAREFFRTLDTFYKARREAERQGDGEGESPAPDETNPTPAGAARGVGTAHDREAPDDVPDPVVPTDLPSASGPTLSPAASAPRPSDETKPTAEAIAADRPSVETNPTAGAIAADRRIDETNPTDGVVATDRRIDETKPTAGVVAANRRIDETKPTPRPAPSPRDDSRTRSGDRTPAPDPGPSRPEPSQRQPWNAELDRLEAQLEAIERMHPLEFLRALGVSPPR